MSPEQHQTPERRSEQPAPGPEANEVIKITLSRLDTPEKELQLLASYLRHGPALAAYLLAEDDALTKGDLEHQLAEAYGGSWDSIDHLLQHTLDILGWTDKLDTLKTDEGIPDHYLTWNKPALLEHLNRMYQFVELDNRIHAFDRRTTSTEDDGY